MKKTIFVLLMFLIVFAACKKEKTIFPTTIRTVQIVGFEGWPTIEYTDNERILLDATTTGALSYIWSTGETTPKIYADTELGGYSVTVTTVDTALIYNVTVQYRGLTFYVPNTFTPNGEQQNDFFGPQGQSINLSNYLMKIYNPELKCVYSTRDVSKSWNGRFHNKDKKCPTGYYHYYFEYSTLLGEAKTKSGMVELWY